MLGWFFLSSRSYSCRFALTHIYSPGLTGSDTSVEYPLQSFPGKRPETAASESLAEVAELADAHGSGPCARKGVGVRVPSSAPALYSQRIRSKLPLLPCPKFWTFSDPQLKSTKELYPVTGRPGSVTIPRRVEKLSIGNESLIRQRKDVLDRQHTSR